MKHSSIYTHSMTFGKYDDGHIIGYLNEEQVKDYLPEEADTPVTGYRYTGTEIDGGTVMPCSDHTSYPEVANAIIRSKYSQSDEMAIHRHYSNDQEQYAEEWNEYNEFCENAKKLAKKWLGIG